MEVIRKAKFSLFTENSIFVFFSDLLYQLLCLYIPPLLVECMAVSSVFKTSFSRERSPTLKTYIFRISKTLLLFQYLGNLSSHFEVLEVVGLALLPLGKERHGAFLSISLQYSSLSSWILYFFKYFLLKTPKN